MVSKLGIPLLNLVLYTTAMEALVYYKYKFEFPGISYCGTAQEIGASDSLRLKILRVTNVWKTNGKFYESNVRDLSVYTVDALSKLYYSSKFRFQTDLYLDVAEGPTSWFVECKVSWTPTEIILAQSSGTEGNTKFEVSYKLPTKYHQLQVTRFEETRIGIIVMDDKKSFQVLDNYRITGSGKGSILGKDGFGTFDPYIHQYAAVSASASKFRDCVPSKTEWTPIYITSFHSGEFQYFESRKLDVEARILQGSQITVQAVLFRDTSQDSIGTLPLLQGFYADFMMNLLDTNDPDDPKPMALSSIVDAASLYQLQLHIAGSWWTVEKKHDLLGTNFLFAVAVQHWILKTTINGTDYYGFIEECPSTSANGIEKSFQIGVSGSGMLHLTVAQALLRENPDLEISAKNISVNSENLVDQLEASAIAVQVQIDKSKKFDPKELNWSSIYIKNFSETRPHSTITYIEPSEAIVQVIAVPTGTGMVKVRREKTIPTEAKIQESIAGNGANPELDIKVTGDLLLDLKAVDMSDDVLSKYVLMFKNAPLLFFLRRIASNQKWLRFEGRKKQLGTGCKIFGKLIEEKKIKVNVKMVLRAKGPVSDRMHLTPPVANITNYLKDVEDAHALDCAWTGKLLLEWDSMTQLCENPHNVVGENPPVLLFLSSIESENSKWRRFLGGSNFLDNGLTIFGSLVQDKVMFRIKDHHILLEVLIDELERKMVIPVVPKVYYETDGQPQVPAKTPNWKNFLDKKKYKFSFNRLLTDFRQSPWIKITVATESDSGLFQKKPTIISYNYVN